MLGKQLQYIELIAMSMESFHTGKNQNKMGCAWSTTQYIKKLDLYIKAQNAPQHYFFTPLLHHQYNQSDARNHYGTKGSNLCMLNFWPSFLNIFMNQTN